MIFFGKHFVFPKAKSRTREEAKVKARTSASTQVKAKAQDAGRRRHDAEKVGWNPMGAVSKVTGPSQWGSMLRGDCEAGSQHDDASRSIGDEDLQQVGAVG